MTTPKEQIDALVAAFFGAFDNAGGRRVDLSVLRELFTAPALIVKACDPEPVIYDLDAFIAPRDRLLNDGSLVGFREEELAGRTEIFGHIAQRLTTYRKRWIASGTPIEVRGMKTFQFVETPRGWRICALAWDDERDGLAVASAEP